MIKRLIAVIAAIITLASVTAYAQSIDAVIENDGTMRLTGFDSFDSRAPYVILSGYDENGRLVGSRILENESASARVMDNAARYKVYRGWEEMSAYDVNVTYATPAPATEAPAVTAAPAVTDAPAATKAPAATEKPETSYPPYVVPPPGPPYERSLDAYFTFSVITGVSSAVGDNGPVYLVDVMRQGKQEQLTVPADAQIVVSSDYYSYMTGSDASALREGDIVYFERNNAGTKIKSMAFIYRPVSENIITSTENYGTDFEKLFSTKGRVYGSPANEPGTVIGYGKNPGKNRYQYAFGAVLDKGAGYFTLINRDGIADNAIEISITEDTIVYTCDMSAKRDRFSISNRSSIVKSTIPKNAVGDDGKISFSDDYSYAYAFARVINGEATEVVIYTGYGE